MVSRFAPASAAHNRKHVREGKMTERRVYSAAGPSYLQFDIIASPRCPVTGMECFCKVCLMQRDPTEQQMRDLDDLYCK
jgi:hypothetical protein